MNQPWFERLLRPTELMAAVALAALTTIVFVSVTTRYLFNWPVPDSFDFSRMLLCIAVFWGVAAACGRDDYIRGDVLWEFMGPRTRLWVDRVGRVFILLFFTLLLWKVFEKVADVRRTGETTSDTRTLLWPFLGLAWLATLLMLGAVVVHFISSLQRSAPLRHDAAQLEEPRV